MKTFTKWRSLSLMVAFVFAAMTLAPAVTLAAQPMVGLGTARSFAVLAGQTVTNTWATTIGGSAGGNVGVSPGSAFTGQETVTMSGAVHLADAVALQAQADLGTAYTDAAGRTPFNTIAVELGGTTLKPGVYVTETGALGLTGVLTLDAQGDPNAVFIFKSASSLITASGSSVRLINGAQPCHVYWQITSSATLGSNSQFVGHLMALTDISAQTGATIRGQLLARNGSVTLDHNTITNDKCASSGGGGTTGGGTLPKTATPLYDVLLVGVALMLVGAGVWSIRKRFE
jgi:LPXTG-motif cell wall-anchored protein